MDAARLLAAGTEHLEAGRLEEAAVLLERARELAPLEPQVHYRLGLLAGDRGDVTQALVEFELAIALDPRNARAYNNQGSMLVRLGRDHEAEGAFRRAIEIDPVLAPPRLNLAQLLERALRTDAAADEYRDAIALGIDAAVFAHHLAALSGVHPPRATDEWVRATFDNFAPAFECQVQEILGYRVPHDLAALLAAHAPVGLDVLDLGCGTGLCGAALSGQSRSLTGIDLSPRMLDRARLRGIYTNLECAEVHAYLATAPAMAFDAVVAADVFIYIGALDAVFAEVARILRPGGWFAFSTEESRNGDYDLRSTGRYSQAQSYIARLARTGFSSIAQPATTIRSEGGGPLDGRLYLFRREHGVRQAVIDADLSRRSKQ